MEHGLRRSFSTFVVLSALAALGYVGHRTGWRAAKFAALWSHEAPAAEDWCDAHNVPDSRCIACHPELAGADPTDWCKEHGVPESKCTVCHPEILTTGAARDWCKEHGVPESSCTICHPEIAVRTAAAATASDVSVARNVEVAPGNNPACQLHELRVQFASAGSIVKSGIAVASVVERPMVDSIAVLGEIEFDPARVAHVVARVAGTVVRVERPLGAEVLQGDVLAYLDSREISDAKAELLATVADLGLSESTLARIEASLGSGLRTKAELAEARAQARRDRIRLFSARQVITNLGLPAAAQDLSGMSDEELVRSVARLGIPAEVSLPSSSAGLLPILAPRDGVVIARDIVGGMVVTAGQSLFTVADVDHLRARLDVSTEDSQRVTLGQKVIFRANRLAVDAAVGKVVWIDPSVDAKTRTASVYAELENQQRQLKTNVFGVARIVTRESAMAVVVPDVAIHWEGCCNVVFVRLTDDIFQTRKVRLGARAAGFTEITVGVLPGEVVATTGSHVLKSEILKSKFGAGCCVDD